jgi:hypothetical protein
MTWGPPGSNFSFEQNDRIDISDRPLAQSLRIAP